MKKTIKVLFIFFSFRFINQPKTIPPTAINMDEKAKLHDYMRVFEPTDRVNNNKVNLFSMQKSKAKEMAKHLTYV